MHTLGLPMVHRLFWRSSNAILRSMSARFRELLNESRLPIVCTPHTLEFRVSVNRIACPTRRQRL